MSEPEPEQPRVTVVDRRRVTEETATADPPPSDSTATTAAAAVEPPPSTSEPEPFDTSDSTGAEGAAAMLPVEDLVRVLLAELSMRAWVHLGLIAHPATGLVVADLPSARLAIDCCAALLEQLAPRLAPAERGELQRMIADLRMNYVQRGA